ncbi:MAG TPA: hypothetical protein VI688_03855 [Anaerolineales bacterium]|nr:hypothetical protein [Anaerolineales bacterium]
MNRNIGMLLLGIWLILEGLAGFNIFTLDGQITAALALIAGILIILGR